MASLNGAPSEPDPQAPSTTSPPSQPTPTTTTTTNPPVPPTSTTDPGLTKRPRDARLLHMILANHGLTAYQERVPLQLLDFAYRYTSSTLQDALHFTSEAYGTAGAGAGVRKAGENATHGDFSAVSLSALRLAIASRTHYQYGATLPKEFYGELAAERNRVGLPGGGRGGGMRVPPERYCLVGAGWELREEWDEVMAEAEDEVVGVGVKEEGDGDDGDAGADGEEEEEEEGGGRMEDLFGGGGDGGDGDREMED